MRITRIEQRQKLGDDERRSRSSQRIEIEIVEERELAQIGTGLEILQGSLQRCLQVLGRSGRRQEIRAADYARRIGVAVQRRQIKVIDRDGPAFGRLLEIERDGRAAGTGGDSCAQYWMPLSSPLRPRILR